MDDGGVKKEYTRKESIILGRRDICETSEDGHRILLTDSSYIRNADGTRKWTEYACQNCDVIVTLTYPEKP